MSVQMLGLEIEPHAELIRLAIELAQDRPRYRTLAEGVRSVEQIPSAAGLVTLLFRESKKPRRCAAVSFSGPVNQRC